MDSDSTIPSNEAITNLSSGSHNTGAATGGVLQEKEFLEILKKFTGKHLCLTLLNGDELKSFMCDIVHYKGLSQNEMSKSFKKN